MDACASRMGGMDLIGMHHLMVHAKLIWDGPRSMSFAGCPLYCSNTSYWFLGCEQYMRDFFADMPVFLLSSLVLDDQTQLAQSK